MVRIAQGQVPQRAPQGPALPSRRCYLSPDGAVGDPPYFALKRRSTRPVKSIVPMTTSHSKNAVPLIRCTMVAASSQMSCMATPITADAGAILFKAPPTRHWYRAATIRAIPATENPILPVSQRSVAVASNARRGLERREAAGRGGFG